LYRLPLLFSKFDNISVNVNRSFLRASFSFKQIEKGKWRRSEEGEKKVNGFSGLIASIILGGLTMHGDEY